MKLNRLQGQIDKPPVGGQSASQYNMLSCLPDLCQVGYKGKYPRPLLAQMDDLAGGIPYPPGVTPLS